MFLDKKATSVIEAIVVLLIVITWIIWMFQVFWNSQKLSASTANKIQAIQIAREWIEAMKNIRDTNWILYSSDTKNCWNILNYKNSCVWENSTTNDILAWSYKIYQDNKHRWHLESKTAYTDKYKNSWYRDNFKIWLDSDGFYTQSLAVKEIKPLFTREIVINYIEDTNWDWNIDSNDEKMEVDSIVYWKDLSSSRPHKVEFKAILTNWKK